MDGGDLIAGVLERQGVSFLFTLCGGHISPILVAAKRRGVRVVDVRHEANAVFAADAAARLTGIPGVAAVTAGPGVTNTVTAVKNAQLAQSPLVLLGGATATLLKGRGALQDIEQMALLDSCVKWSRSVRRVRDLVPVLEEAFFQAQEGVPGPVLVECPVDLLYGEEVVRGWYGARTDGAGGGGGGRLLRWYLRLHLYRLFAGADRVTFQGRIAVGPPEPDAGAVAGAAARFEGAQRPVLLVGSQAALQASAIGLVADAVERLGAPTYLSGMARGLLGKDHPLQIRHRRRRALREADLVLLAGVPCDFRLDYGRHIPRGAELIAVNRSAEDLAKNRRPDLGILADPGAFLGRLAAAVGGRDGRWRGWLERLKERDRERDDEIAGLSEEDVELVNPLYLCRAIDRVLDDDSVLVADGGDFVATASYIISPRGPLRWMDPGVFGTLGVGAGFALGAKLCRPSAEVWVLYGDGSAAYSLAEFDTFVRHGVPVIAVVGNDAGWTQIAREQVEILEDDVGTTLRRSAYHRVAEGYGGKGLEVVHGDEVGAALARAQAEARAGNPVLLNAQIGHTDFRKGSISM